MTVFTDKSPWIMTLLMRDFGFSDLDAAAVMGNAGAESGGLEKFQEINPTVSGSRGGWGWFQWTGPRRRAFEAYCRRNHLDPKSDKANYGFLFVELEGDEKRAVDKTKDAQGLNPKTKAFEMAFERAGIKHYDARYRWARKALDAYHAAPKPIALPDWVDAAPTPSPVPVPDPVPIPQPPDVEPVPEPPVKQGFWATIIAAIREYFRKGR